MANDDAFLQVDIETKEFDDKVVFSALKLSLEGRDYLDIWPEWCEKQRCRMIAGLESAGKRDISLPMIENLHWLFSRNLFSTLT